MHILLGALLGALVSTVMTLAVSLVLGRRPTLRELLLAAASGALGGAITTATLGVGAGAFAATSTGRALGREAGALALGGAVAGGSERAAHNALDGRALGDGVVTHAAVGGATGAAFPVVRNALAPVVRDTVAPAVRRAADALRPGRTGAGSATASTTARAATGAATEAPAPSTGMLHVLDADAARGTSRPAGAVDATTTTTTTTGTTTTGATSGTTTTTTATNAADSTATRVATNAPGRPAGATWDEVMARGAARGYRSVHAAAPAWLEARMAATVDAVRRGAAGPAAKPDDVASFLRETAEHVDEVNALVRALGGRAREVPSTLPASGELRGIHDLGERASLRRVEELVASLRREPLRDRDGAPLEVPDWLARLVRDAKARGETTIDVGKLSPHVAAGLGRAGPADPFAIRLHNLSAHHHHFEASATGRPSGALIESIADRVNAMRQPRIYRPEPMPFERIESIILEDVAAGRLPPEAAPLARRAIELQGALEREGRVVNPYHLLSPAPAPTPAMVDGPLGY